MTQVRPAPGWLAPAPSKADSRPPRLSEPTSSLLARVAAHTFCCGWSVSGQSQEIFSGLGRATAPAPGVAYDGVIASMVTERWPALARSTALACAGAADASPAARLADKIAAGMANTAVLRRVRLRFAVSKPRTPGMLVS